MNIPASNASDLAEVLREIRELGGAPVGPSALAAPLGFPSDWKTIRDWTAFESVLERYASEVIVARDWPATVKAWDLARQGHSAELLEFDRQWHPGDSSALSEASWRVGRRQLHRMRPLRDLRVVQRYLAAVDSGAARGWHPLVYGVFLDAYGVPLRQGLAHYAHQTAGGWVDSVLRVRDWSRAEGEASAARVCASLVPRMPSLPDASLFTTVPGFGVRS